MTNQLSPARTRFAPSPTGSLHIGGLRTVVFSWLWAKHTGGQFLLRIEDTDRKRYLPESEEQLKRAIRAIGIEWDEGPDVGGPHAPYSQSERLPLYHRHAAELEAKGVAYRSYLTAEEIEAINAQRQADGEGKLREFRNQPGIDDAARAAAGAPHTLRLALRREGQTVLNDLIRGPIVFDNGAIGDPDPVLLKSDGFPTYALAAMVDDHEMGITHVLRADEWIASGYVHVQIYEALGWEQPVWVHVPQVLGPDGKKFSKRHGATGVEEYLAQGFIPEAIVNFLALVGWSYDDKTEIMSIDELIERFDIKRIRPSGGMFDQEKLLHFNGVYLRSMSVEELTGRIAPKLSAAGLVSDPPTAAELARLHQLVPLIQERIKLLNEAPELLEFFFVRPAQYDAALLVPKKTEPAEAHAALQAARAAMEGIAEWSEPALEERLRALADELGLKPGQLFMTLRVAATGRTVSPGLFETLVALGKDETIARIGNAASTLAPSVAIS
ncbi:MAG TPA: glutamate--tRNA ligase [Herpetosiphonaceae bacterium]